MKHRHKNIIVFVHIEKAAGTTFNHILRTNFFFRHYDIRPFSVESNRVFQIRDLEVALKINPFIRSISGHSIIPTVPLKTILPDLRYITLLREPTSRYVSQYYYWTKQLRKRISFQDFLMTKATFNVQTKKIAGEENLKRAKSILRRNFFLVGIVEEFDQFLLVLKKRLLPEFFDPGYRKQNVAITDSAYVKKRAEILRSYYTEIVDRNKLDIKLYNYVKQDVFRKEKDNYGPDFAEAVNAFRQRLQSYRWPISRYLDYFYRKLYIDPATGIIRMKNTLPYKGSY